MNNNFYDAQKASLTCKISFVGSKTSMLIVAVVSNRVIVQVHMARRESRNILGTFASSGWAHLKI
jgi:hypothetical protein